jgi:hypothetical protein
MGWLGGFIIGDPDTWFVLKDLSKLIGYDANLLLGACSAKQSLPEE